METYLLLAGLVIVSTIGTITDIRSNQIPNKLILAGLIYAAIFQGYYFINNGYSQIREFIVFVLLSTVISTLIYIFKVWAGGDTKLFITLSLLLPSHTYANNPINNIVIVMIYIYSIAFVYIIIESIYLARNNFKKLTFKIRNTNQFFIDWIFAFSVIELFQLLLRVVLGDIYNKYYLILVFSNLFIILMINKKLASINKIIKVIIGSMGIIYFVISMSIEHSINKTSIMGIIIVLVVFIFRNWASNYNYKMIMISELKKGMILSTSTIMLFANSRVSNLPHIATEDMSARISQEEVDAVIRWSKTKKGCDQIYIVRKLPFAMFICIGYIAFVFIIKIAYAS